MSTAPRPRQPRRFFSVTGFIQLVILLVVGVCFGRFFLGEQAPPAVPVAAPAGPVLVPAIPAPRRRP